MSLSPSESVSMNSDQGSLFGPSTKRKRTSFDSHNDGGPTPRAHIDSGAHTGPSNGNNGANESGSINGGPSSSYVPKRGARACTACRKGKNRCEGEVSASTTGMANDCPHRHDPQSPCRRCQLSGTPCLFEKPEKKTTQPGNQQGLE